MSNTKKILFLNYADTNPDDIVMFRNLSLHLSVLKDKIESWSKNKVTPGEESQSVIEQNFKKADAVIHLLSIHFENENQCIALLEDSMKENKTIIPILISPFDWESDSTLKQLEHKLLPENKTPVDSFKNNNEILTQIVKAIKSEIFGQSMPDTKRNDRWFYYALAFIVLSIGCIASYWVHTIFNNFIISLGVLLMFLCVIVFVLRKIIFPTNISSM